jgi:hypothetical protein
MLGHASPPGRELLTRLAMSAGLLSPQAAAPCNRNPAGRVAALAGGLVAGAVQAFLLRDRLARSWGWAAAMPLLWGAGLDGHRRRRGWRRSPVRGLRCLRHDHLHGAVGCCWSGYAPPPQPRHPRRTARHRDCLAAASTTAGRRAWLAGLTTGWWPDPAEGQASGFAQAERLVGVTGLLSGAARTAVG